MSKSILITLLAAACLLYGAAASAQEAEEATEKANQGQTDAPEAEPEEAPTGDAAEAESSEAEADAEPDEKSAQEADGVNDEDETDSMVRPTEVPDQMKQRVGAFWFITIGN